MGDPTVREWADDILDAALKEAESSARRFAPRVLDEAAEKAARTAPKKAADALATTTSKMTAALRGALDTAVGSCLDFDHHPDTGERCTASFDTCLMCSNALILERHLPALHAMADRMQRALNDLDAETWCRRYAVLWLILTRNILPKFSAAQRNNAGSASVGVLDALDGLTEAR